MSKSILIFSFFLYLHIFSGCINEPDPVPVSTIGHLHITVRYQTTKKDSIPDVGAYAMLFNEEARCPDYWEAIQGFAKLDGRTVYRRFYNNANELGEVHLYNMQAGSYYLALVSVGMDRYTDSIIEIPLKDTLFLIKYFTNSGSFIEDYEPWDYVKRNF